VVNGVWEDRGSWGTFKLGKEAPTEAVARLRTMRIGIIDIGSNTARLLVAGVDGASVERLDEERAHLGLGAAIERTGGLPEDKLAETAGLAAEYAVRATANDVDVVEVIVTAPGRQSENGAELVHRLRAATGATVRVLSCDEEGRYAYDGAAAMLDRHPKVLAVCDIGGGSTEVAVGLRDVGPVLLRSFEIGSMRLTSRFFDGRPTRAAVAKARRFVRRRLADLDAPAPTAALATGGTAGALRKIAGRSLPAGLLESVIEELRSRPPGRIAAAYGLERSRARTILAGALILAEVQQRLDVPFEVARGGLREGAALALARVDQAA
jgi:exopolyphosphatase / guanosine-5'-triphosphate,3'-diphosphate pyrophosphatase